ncbi:BnaA02g32860D [Brassica napus]|uniref:BnaA02g32860D protein n=1 Tax=Brassica napus TaxID=3708 RepID=A0A078I7R1_BRANA|nr:BnaA02g32860D [Brassica napus]
MPQKSRFLSLHRLLLLLRIKHSTSPSNPSRGSNSIMDDHTHIEKSQPLSRKRSRRPKRLDFVGWGSKNLIHFLKSLGRDTTDKISEYDVTFIVRKYIREELTHPSKKKTKIVTCDVKLRLLFGCQKINVAKLPDLVAKHYVENQDGEEFDYLYSSEDDDDDKKGRLCLSDKEVVDEKRRGSVAAIVRDNVKLLYLRKSLVEELAKTCEMFEGKVVGSFVRIKNPCQLVHVTGVKEWNPIDGYFLQVTNYCYYLKDVASSALSDDDFTQEECEELQQRMKNGSVKRLTVVDMEEKVRSLHEDVTKHWIARELEDGKENILFSLSIINNIYLDRRELLSNPEEKSRLLLEVPEVIAEEPEPERVDVDVDIEDDFMEPNHAASIEPHYDEKQELKDSPEAVAEECVDVDVKVEDHSIETPKLRDEEDQPPWAASAGDKDLIEEDVIITKNNKDSIYDQPQTQPNSIEIIELSDEDDEEEANDNGVYKQCDPKKKMWCYEMPKGETHGPFSLADLKEWSDQEYFVDIPDFKVWKTGNSIESAVLLTKLLSHVKA